MSYQPVQDSRNANGSKAVELEEDSETDVGGYSRGSEDTFFLGWKRKGFGKIPIRDLYKVVCEANVPLVVSLHFLVLNIILSIALVSQLWRGSQYGPTRVQSDAQFAPGELLWSQFKSCGFFQPRLTI